MPSLTELDDVWVLHDGKMVAQGNAKAIDALFETKLVELKTGPFFIVTRIPKSFGI